MNQCEKLSIMKKNCNQKKIYLLVLLAIAALLVGIALFFVFRTTEDKSQLTTQEHISLEDIEYDLYVPAESETVDSDKSDLVYKGSKGGTKESEEYLTPEMEQMPTYNKGAKYEGNYFEVLRPAKTPFIVVCRNLYKTFDFQWASNAETIEVILRDRNGRVIMDREITEAGLQLKYEDYYKFLEVFWELKATYADGTSETKVGVLQLLVD